ncbi:MAG: LptF/LptG family permease [Myxococcales bacterium]|nr:MAG: LptF/LptG family permease [Myxococcales bacterium]
MMRRLSRSLLADWSRQFAAAMAAILAVLAVAQTPRLGANLFAANLGWRQALSLAANALPPLLAVALPLAQLAAWLLVFARLRRDGEWPALAAAGISPCRLLMPIGLTALLVATAVLGLAHILAPQSLDRAIRTAESGFAETLNATLAAGQTVDLDGKFFLSAQGVGGDGALSQPFFAIEKTDERHVFWAKQAQLTTAGPSPRLQLESGTWEWTQGAQTRRASFDHLTLNAGLWIQSEQAGFASWQTSDSLSLARQTRTCPSTDDDCRRMRSELARRWASGTAVVGFSLFAFAFGCRNSFASRQAAWAVAAGATFAYYLLERAALVLSDKALFPPTPALLLPALAIAALAFFRWRRGRT